jgi:hypothetical protein
MRFRSRPASSDVGVAYSSLALLQLFLFDRIMAR